MRHRERAGVKQGGLPGGGGLWRVSPRPPSCPAHWASRSQLPHRHGPEEQQDRQPARERDLQLHEGALPLFQGEALPRLQVRELPGPPSPKPGLPLSTPPTPRYAPLLAVRTHMCAGAQATSALALGSEGGRQARQAAQGTDGGCRGQLELCPPRASSVRRGEVRGLHPEGPTRASLSSNAHCHVSGPDSDLSHEAAAQ